MLAEREAAHALIKLNVSADVCVCLSVGVWGACDEEGGGANKR